MNAANVLKFQERPYQDDSTASRLLSEVKHPRAWLVLRWGTTFFFRKNPDVFVPVEERFDCFKQFLLDDDVGDALSSRDVNSYRNSGLQEA